MMSMLVEGQLRVALGVFVVCGAIALNATSARAQASANGIIYGSYYASEDTALGARNDVYTGLLLNAAPIATNRNFRFKADLRVARQSEPSDWNEKVYSLYADWRSKDRMFNARLGRQLLYRGVLRWTSDGLWLQARPTSGFEIGVFGGLAARYGKSLDLYSWDDGGLIGGAGSYTFGPEAKIEASYINRRSSAETAWHQIGGSLTGRIVQGLLYNTEVEYNLLKSTLQAARLRLMYLIEQWTVSGEFNNQKPRIYEDSYFNIFELVAFNQIRGSVSYRFARRYSVGAAYMHTMYDEDETNDAVQLFVGGPWGQIGGVFQGGYGGERVGVFGELRYDVLRTLELFARASHQNYERRNISVEQDATGFSGGARFRPAKPWLIHIEAQQAINTYFDKNWRMLVRAQYAFDFSPQR